MNRSSVLKKSFKVIAFLIAPLLLVAVKCDRPESVGPEFAIAPEGFAVNNFSIGNSTVNFSTTPKDTFYASFNSNVSWTMTLTGLTSGATKEIKGTSQQIDGSNLSWLWDGSHDGLHFFRKNEQVEVVISFLGSDLVVKDTIQQIVNTKTFKDLVVLDFETVPAWISYSDATGGDNPSGLQVLVEGQTLNATGGAGRVFSKSVQGTNSFYWYSKDVGDYFGGGAAKAITALQRASFPSDVDSLYLNVYIYGMGDANSKLNFGAREDDNGNGSHQPASEDEFQVQISLDHTGWKLFSFKYSDLAPSASPTNGGSGDKIKDPKKITDISFGLISSPPNNFVEAIIDFPVITFGRPFDPAK